MAKTCQAFRERWSQCTTLPPAFPVGTLQEHITLAKRNVAELQGLATCPDTRHLVTGSLNPAQMVNQPGLFPVRQLLPCPALHDNIGPGCGRVGNVGENTYAYGRPFQSPEYATNLWLSLVAENRSTSGGSTLPHMTWNKKTFPLQPHFPSDAGVPTHAWCPLCCTQYLIIAWLAHQASFGHRYLIACLPTQDRLASITYVQTLFALSTT